jgi:hypothetical protein
MYIIPEVDKELPSKPAEIVLEQQEILEKVLFEEAWTPPEARDESEISKATWFGDDTFCIPQISKMDRNGSINVKF